MCMRYLDEDIRGLLPHDPDNEALCHAFEQYDLLDCGSNAKTLGQLLEQKLKLGVINRQIFDSEYELGGLRQPDVSDGFMVLLPKSKAAGIDMLALDQQLRHWYKEASSFKNFALGQDHRRNGPVVGVHTATLEMLYLTLLSLVHSPQLLHDQDPGSADEALQKFSRVTLRSAARRITDIGASLADCQLVPLLPGEAVEAFLVASIQHLRDMMMTELDLRNTESLYLRQTRQMLARLEDKYSSARSALGFIKRFMNGDFFLRPPGLEDRVHLMTRWGYDLARSHAGEEEADDASKAITHRRSTLQSAQTASATPRHGADFQTILHNDGFLTRSNDPVPNLEGYSEILLTTMDWSEVDASTAEEQIH